VEPTRKGNRDAGAAPHGVYPCQGEDRWIAIACFSDAEWHALRQMISPTGDSWPDQDRFSSLRGRKAAEDELDRLMADWTRGWEAKTLMETLQQAGVPALCQ
jgi:crotonobetainyl-CoA:carnitine CoA-transferase CaiB-like acyl-CoA transferase